MKKLIYSISLLLLLASCTPTYIVTFNGSIGGSVSEVGGEYDEGTIISVDAQPDNGYEFQGWSDGSIQNPRTITVSQNLNLTALFSKQQFSVSVNTQGEGTVATSGATGQGSFEYGSSARFEAVPAAGWEFDSWSGDASGSSNPLNISVDGPLTITATFKRQKFDLTVTVEGEGTVTEQVIVHPGQYDYEAQVKLTAVPNEGWEFVNWSGDIGSTENPVNVTVSRAKNVTANFKELEIVSIEILNPIDSLVISRVHKYQVEGTYSNGNKVDLSDGVALLTTELAILNDDSLESILTPLDNNQFTGRKSGSVFLTIQFNNIQTTTEFVVLPFEFVDVPEQLKVNANNELIIPVIILSYLPTVDGVNLDLKRAPDGYWNLYNSSLEQSKDKILNESIVSRRYWEEGSKFRGFQNSSSESYIGIEVVSYINIYEMDFNPIGDGSGKKIDYFSLFEKLNLREIIEGKGVKEIWFNHYPLYDSPVVSNHPELYGNRNDFWGLDESNMSSPTTGDISNSSRENDLPIYNSTYVVYAFNQRNGFGNHIHCRGHQIEAQLSFIENGVIYPSGPIAESSLFLGEFVGITNNNGGWLFQPGKVGRVHNPPNTYDDEQYGYSIDRVFSSNILNWKPNGGETSFINHTLWNSIEYGDDFYFYNYIGGQPNTSETNWLLFWFQSIPGYQNNIPYEKDGVEYTLTNWWDLIYNWDEAVTQGKTLWE
jgi:ribosomal protein S9